jgi:hypothetical protein
MGEMSHIYDAIEEFKKFPTPEQKQLASKFLSYYNGPNGKFIEEEFDWDDFEKGDLGDDGLEELIEFLQGEDPFPFYKSDPPEDIWQEIMNSFNEFLFKSLPELQALKKGYDEPVRLDLSLEQILETVRSLTQYKHRVAEIKRKILPEIEKIVKNELGKTPVEYNELSQTLTSLHGTIKSAVNELTWFWKAKNAKIMGDSRESFQKAKGRQRQITAHMKQYSREVVQMTKEQINFLKYIDVFKTRLPAHIKRTMAEGSLSQENVNGLKKLESYVMDDLSDIVGHNIPFLGVYKTYKAGDKKMAAAIGIIDIFFVFSAVAAAGASVATGPIAAALAIAGLFVGDVLLGTTLMIAVEEAGGLWDNAVDFWVPQTSDAHKRLDYIEQRGIKSD